jgi:hypothetical protein
LAELLALGLAELGRLRLAEVVLLALKGRSRLLLALRLAQVILAVRILVVTISHDFFSWTSPFAHPQPTAQGRLAFPAAPFQCDELPAMRRTEKQATKEPPGRTPTARLRAGWKARKP